MTLFHKLDMFHLLFLPAHVAKTRTNSLIFSQSVGDESESSVLFTISPPISICALNLKLMPYVICFCCVSALHSGVVAG